MGGRRRRREREKDYSSILLSQTQSGGRRGIKIHPKPEKTLGKINVLIFMQNKAFFKKIMHSTLLVNSLPPRRNYCQESRGSGSIVAKAAFWCPGTKLFLLPPSALPPFSLGGLKCALFLPANVDQQNMIT